MLLVALFLALYYYTKSVDCYLMFCDGNCFWNVKRSVIWVSGAIFLWKIDSFLTKELWHDLLNLILHREIQLKSLIFKLNLKRNNVTDNFSHLKLFIHQMKSNSRLSFWFPLWKGNLRSVHFHFQTWKSIPSATQAHHHHMWYVCMRAEKCSAQLFGKQAAWFSVPLQSFGSVALEALSALMNSLIPKTSAATNSHSKCGCSELQYHR